MTRRSALADGRCWSRSGGRPALPRPQQSPPLLGHSRLVRDRYKSPPTTSQPSQGRAIRWPAARELAALMTGCSSAPARAALSALRNHARLRAPSGGCASRQCPRGMRFAWVSRILRGSCESRLGDELHRPAARPAALSVALQSPAHLTLPLHDFPSKRTLSVVVPRPRDAQAPLVRMNRSERNGETIPRP